MLAVIAHATDAKNGNLPEVILIDFSNCHLEVVAYPRHHRFDHLSFLFQRMTCGQVQCNLTGSYYHAPSIAYSMEKCTQALPHSRTFPPKIFSLDAYA